MTATAVLGITAHVPENLERFEEGFAEMKAGASPGSQPAYEHVSVAMAVANNYFGGLWFLIENDLIERDFILNRFANLSLTAHSDQVALGARQPRPDFDKMARASYEYLKDRGLDAQPPVVATVLQSGSE
jgi:hypothetical protein